MASECVKVMVRCRPMNTLEKTKNSSMCVQTNSQNCAVTLLEGENGDGQVREFTYDRVYGIESTQREVFDQCAFPLVESVLGGYNGTIFAYGQTGCGKTHTMVGKKGSDQQGIIPNSFEQIYGYIDDPSNGSKKFLVRCSYLEIYNEEIRDLLGNDTEAKLELKENKDKGVFVKDLTIMTVKSVKEIEDYMAEGTKSRKVGATAMNAESSRSHSLFTIYIETAETIAGKQLFKAGKLNLVDLAGSERQSKTQAEGIRLKEATKINLSLSALGNVISALVDGKSQHVPYRDSKLTRLLQDSLGGNTKTVMIAAISPSDFSYDETLSTLRYASRAKAIKNKPRVNEDPKDALLKQYEDEIKRLRAMLENQQQPGAPGPAMAPSLPTLKPAHSTSVVEARAEESVEDLLARLANKGHQVQLVDEQKQARSKEQQIQQQREMEELQAVMRQMEDKLVQGGHAMADKERENAHHKREMQLKLQLEIEKQEKLAQEKAQKEAELLEREQQYGSLQEEVVEQRTIIKKLRAKYKTLERDLKDAQREKEGDRQDLLDTIREQAKDLDFYQGVLAMLLTKNELYKIKDKVEFDFDKNKWLVPPFILKNKEVSFPKIANAINLVEQNFEERELAFTDEQMRGGEMDRNFQSENKKFSFEKPSASIISQGKTVLPRNKVLFSTNEGHSPEKKVMSPFHKQNGTKRAFSNESYTNEEFHSNADINSAHLKELQPQNGHTTAADFPIQNRARHESDFMIRKGKHKYTSQTRDEEYNQSSPLLKLPNQNNIKLLPLSHQPLGLDNGSNLGSSKQTESHPVLSQKVPDPRIKLEKLTHMQANFDLAMQNIGEMRDGKTAINFPPTNQKRGMLQPLSNSNSVATIQQVNQNAPSVIGKKNIRTLNPIQK